MTLSSPPPVDPPLDAPGADHSSVLPPPGVAHHLVDLFLAETRRRGDRDFLFAASAHVFRRHIDDAIRVDVESHFDLRNAARCRRDADEVELAERAVVSGQRPLTLQYVNFN